MIRAIEPPAHDATAADLEQQADSLRADKLYLDALDYYRAALSKKQNDARLLNKIGITELMMQRYHEAQKSFERAVRADHDFADAYNNLGVILYESKRWNAAIKQYEKAIAKDSSSASFYSNLGAALFFQAGVRTRRGRLPEGAGDGSGCVWADVSKRSAGAIAQS